MDRFFTVLLLASLFITVSEASLAQGQVSENDQVYPYLLNLSIEELMSIPVESSGLFPMDWDEAPGIYYNTDKESLDQYGYRSIGEYLQKSVPGIHTATHGNQGTLLGVRGILVDTNSKTILLRDNLNINTRTLVGINGSKLSTPLLGDIDRIEVALGPGTVRHGSGAINGSINMITATGKSKEGLRVNTSYGSGNSRLFEASYGIANNDKYNLFLYGGYSKSSGVAIHYTLPKDEWASYTGVTGTPSDVFLDNAKIGKTDDDFRMSFRAQLGEKQDFFSLDLKATLARTTNVDPALGYYLAPNPSWPEEVRLAAEARGGGRYSPFYIQYDEEFILSPELIFNFGERHSTRVIPYYINQRSGNEFSNELLDWINRLNLTLTEKDDCPIFNCAEDYPSYGWETHTGLTAIHNYTGFDNQQLGLGAEYRHSDFHYFTREWDTLSAFAEDQLTHGDFSFLVGLRYDKIYYEDSMISLGPAPIYDTGPYNAPANEDALTKRLAVSYNLSPKHAIKLSYQEGFRFADKLPQHWLAHQVIAANLPETTIAPEESTSYEMNYAAFDLFNHQINLTTTAYYNIYEYTHGWIADQSNFGNSATQFKSIGGEFAINYKANKAIDLGLSYSYAHPLDSFETDIKIANNDETWTRFPEHMFKFKVGYTITKNLFIGSTSTFESPRYNKAETNPAVAELFNVWDFKADALISYKFNASTQLSFTAKELIRTNYNQSTAYFQGTRPLDSPRAEDPQYYLTLTYNH